ncbi:MAG: heparinase II/III family protein [Ignavibacteria bacterium]|nr:heparinase II/III family protein [Ignavibacteria bacterium]
MNIPWRVRILLGPMRPFVVRKVRDALRERFLVRMLRRQLPTHVHEGRSLRTGVTPLPSASWFAAHSSDVLAFASSMRMGVVGAYGIGHWRVGDPDPTGVDTRSVHELSRMHHWCAYALAAHIDREHRDEWCDLLFDEISTFMRTTPAEHGIHWQFPMGTGIRLHSMLVAWDWARRSGWEHAEGEHRVAAYAVDHARSVVARRESRGGLSTSHYAANLLGIRAAGIYLVGEPAAAHWSDLAANELSKELYRQILPDGMANEGSTGYHRQVTDLFVQAAALGAFSPDELTKIGGAVERCRNLEQHGMPLIGDNDDGLAMKLTGFTPDLDYLYDVGTRMCGSADVGDEDLVAPDLGLTIRRSGSMITSLRNGPVGQFGKGGHAHNDQNSITVSIGGEPFVVDPGTSCYTSDPIQRDIERSVHQHATMWSVSSEQAFMPPGEEGMFWLLDDELETEVVANTGSVWHGIVSAQDGRRHERHVALGEDHLSVRDVYTPTAKDPMAEWVLPLGEGVEVELDANKAILRGRKTSALLTWDNGTMIVDRSMISPCFAETRVALCLRIRTNALSWTLSNFAA